MAGNLLPKKKKKTLKEGEKLDQKEHEERVCRGSSTHCEDILNVFIIVHIKLERGLNNIKYSQFNLFYESFYSIKGFHATSCLGITKDSDIMEKSLEFSSFFLFVR